MSLRKGKAYAELIKAQAAAFKIHKLLEFPHPNDVPIDDLAMSRGVLVVEKPMLGAEGRLLRKRSRGIIHIDSRIPQEGRRRFTVAHELGHWEMHKQYSQFLCSEDDMRDYGKSPLEMEANCFAAELLMPTFHFRKAIEKKSPSMKLIQSLAREFNTTLTATAMRFAEVSKHNLLVVWHQFNSVSWCYSPSKKDLPYVIKGRQPAAFSSATLNPSEVVDHMFYYDQANWFPELRDRIYGVQEETLSMPRLQGGLTLLWLP